MIEHPQHPVLSVSDVVALVGDLYADARGAIKYKQKLRPHICPFHIIALRVPTGASVLDVGCGAGLFILLLRRLGRVRSATGFDASEAAIQTAQKIAARLPNPGRMQFEHRDANDAWPVGRFDVVCLIDVLHHVQPERQAGLFATAVEHVADGGILLYKDMASRPRWRALANRLHDLISAGDWIHYVQLDDVINWAQKAGLRLEENGKINMLWYRHEWCIFRRPND